MRRVTRKRCYHCQLHKTPDNIDAFHKNGTDDYCKACRKIIAHAYYLRKKEQVLAGNRAYQKNNRPKMRKIAAAWREKNPEKVLEYDRKWKADNKELRYQRDRERYNSEEASIKNAKYREEHPEEFAAAKKRWNQEHPEKVKMHIATRRARQKGAAINDFTDAHWEFLERLYEGRCAYCNIAPATPLHRDHIVALLQHGDNTLSNVLPSCQSCNSKKGTKYFIIPYLIRCAYGIERQIQVIKNQ